jgi:hypothetical protein
LPGGSLVYKFEGGGFNATYGFSSRGGWTGNDTFNPGEAVFVSVPSATTITLVGQVLQGSLTNVNVAPSGGFSFLSSIAPVSGTIDGSVTNGGLSYTPIQGDFIYLYDTNTAGYDVYGYGRGGWAPSDPVIPIATGFFLSTSQTSWVENFSVQ